MSEESDLVAKIITNDINILVEDLNNVIKAHNVLVDENQQLKEENKRLNNIYDELKDYMLDIDWKIGWQYANYLDDLLKGDKE